MFPVALYEFENWSVIVTEEHWLRSAQEQDAEEDMWD